MFDPQDYMAATDYSVAWLVYLVAALVLLFLQWRVSRRWQRDLRFLLLALAALVLLMPAPLQGHNVMVPALGFLLLGAFTGGGPEALAPVLVRLALGGAVVLLVVLAEAFWWRARQRRQRAQAAERVRRRQQRARAGV